MKIDSKLTFGIGGGSFFGGSLVMVAPGLKEWKRMKIIPKTLNINISLNTTANFFINNDKDGPCPGLMCQSFCQGVSFRPDLLFRNLAKTKSKSYRRFR